MELKAGIWLSVLLLLLCITNGDMRRPERRLDTMDHVMAFGITLGGEGRYVPASVAL